MKNKRTRNWAIVLYPESLPENYLEIIDNLHVKALLSPLHKDLNPDNTEKKEHYHLLLMFEGVKSYSQVLKISNELNATVPIVVESAIGYGRYLVHLDNPEKEQYSVKDIKAFGGADVNKILDLESRHKTDTLNDIIDFVIKNDIDEFKYLILYARSRKPEWSEILLYNGVYFLDKLITSIRHSKDNLEKVDEEGNLINLETGEVMYNIFDKYDNN